ncbi:MAG: hypothetical protein WCW04_01305 [Candidatus Paceibacterota bacterium]|jgi:hypothetical protein
MKNFKGLLFVIMIVSTITVNAQEFKISDITISSGKTALTSGLDTKVSFSNGKNRVLFIQANADRAILNIGKKIKNFQIVESFGVYKNVLWTGPQITYQKGIIDVMLWNGVGFGKDKELTSPGTKPEFFLSYEGVGITVFKNYRIGGSVLWFRTDPMNWFVSAKRTFSIGEKSKIFTEVTYNHTLDIPMFVIGYSLKFN